MPKLRASTTTRFYDPDDEGEPRRRKRRGRNDLRMAVGIILIMLAIYFLSHGSH